MSEQRSEIVLIGPHRAGKSTVAAILASRLGLPVCAEDSLRWTYFHELGYDEAYAEYLRETEGFRSLEQYWEPFAIHAVERVLQEYRDCVFAFGAGAIVQDDPERAARARRALTPFRNVVLILPSPDLNESVRMLDERIGPWVSDTIPFFDFNRYYVHHPCNHTLATLKAYAKGRTPEQTCDEILRQMHR